jgi:hypothetical protein
MSVIQIPGGTATLRDKLVSERHYRVIEAAQTSASGAMLKVRDVLVAAAAERAGIADPEHMSPEDEKSVQKVIDDLTPEETGRITAPVHFTLDESEAMLALRDASIVAFLEHWSLKRPLPTLATVQDLDRDLYQALADATQGLVVKESVANFDPTPKVDNSTPTVNSGSSDGPSSADPELTSTLTLPDESGSTASEA